MFCPQNGPYEWGGIAAKPAKARPGASRGAQPSSRWCPAQEAENGGSWGHGETENARTAQTQRPKWPGEWLWHAGRSASLWSQQPCCVTELHSLWGEAEWQPEDASRVPLSYGPQWEREHQWRAGGHECQEEVRKRMSGQYVLFGIQVMYKNSAPWHKYDEWIQQDKHY